MNAAPRLWPAALGSLAIIVALGVGLAMVWPVGKARANEPASPPLRVASTHLVHVRVLTYEAQTRWAERCEAGGNHATVGMRSVSCWPDRYSSPALWEVTADELAEEEGEP